MTGDVHRGSGDASLRGSGVSPLCNGGASSALKRRDAASPSAAPSAAFSDVACPPAPRFFSRFASTACTKANLPHWDQDGVTCFVTFRLADSLPREKLLPFLAERDEWLEKHPQPWDEPTACEYAESFDGVAEKWLDESYGSCILGEAASRRLVEDALRHFNGARYVLYAFVVMPNHVHVLFMPNVGESIAGILHSWKSYTAHRLIHKGNGPVWQKESWDRLIRNAEHFRKVTRYIKGNDATLSWSAYDELQERESR